MTSLKNSAIVEFFDKDTGKKIDFAQGAVVGVMQENVNSYNYEAEAFKSANREFTFTASLPSIILEKENDLNKYLSFGIEARMHYEFLRRQLHRSDIR